MLDRIADLLAANIDDITREWVEELRGSDRTEIHKQLLTSEIVTGTKAMLSNLAETLGDKNVSRATPGSDNSFPTVPRLTGELSGKSPRMSRPKGTTPLNSPLVRAGHVAASHGKHRQAQGYEFHEIVLEFVKLRQIILRRVMDGMESSIRTEFVTALSAFNLLFDELLLTAVENFHQASVRDLEQRAIHDPLTQIYNKEYFRQRLASEIRRAVRSDEMVSVALVDMDRLKQINDTYGHAAGDAVIQAVAAAIRNSCRRGDVPCRVGGDEFGVILPDTDKVQGQAFAERLMKSLRNVVVNVGPGDGTKVAQAGAITANTGMAPLSLPAPTMSVGIATFPQDARDPETLAAKADAALYRAKHAGRNQIGI